MPKPYRPQLHERHINDKGMNYRVMDVKDLNHSNGESTYRVLWASDQDMAQGKTGEWKDEGTFWADYENEGFKPAQSPKEDLP